MKKTQRTPFGIFQQSGPCAYCHGQGELPQNNCSKCHSEGVIRKRKEIEVKIPAGVEEGMRLRVAGEGEIGDAHGSAGDLYVILHIKDHPYFERKENDLHILIPISFTQAALGDEVEVPTINGKAKLKIPLGTNSETILRMVGKGIPDVHGDGRGDQMVKVRIEVPQKLSKKQVDLIQQLHEEKPAKGLWGRMFG